MALVSAYVSNMDPHMALVGAGVSNMGAHMVHVEQHVVVVGGGGGGGGGHNPLPPKSNIKRCGRG
jgi:hypothetical protein